MKRAVILSAMVVLSFCWTGRAAPQTPIGYPVDVWISAYGIDGNRILGSYDLVLGTDTEPPGFVYGRDVKEVPSPGAIILAGLGVLLVGLLRHKML